MSELVIDDVTVRYGPSTALDHVTIEVDRGETIAVLGPSGSGKSTMLRAVAGLEPLVSGRILLGGRDLAGVPTHRRGLGLMFQDHGLFTHLDVADNVAYGLKIAGVDRKARRARVAELLALVGLSGFERRRTNQLSGGEAQRVALARALAPEPGLLMLDEPLGSLDRALRDQLTGDLRRLLTELGQTAIHVTHDQTEAFAIADRVAILADGRLSAIGSPAELWADPKTRFVAEFLGHPNIITVEVEPGGAVGWAGHRLGSVGPDHRLLAGARSGAVLAVLPATAVGLAGEAGTGIDATVEEIVFGRGVSEVTAAVGSDTDDRLRFTTTEPLSVGQRIRFVVDGRALRPLVEE